MSEEDGITHIDIEQNDLLDDLPDEYLGADELPLEAIDLGDEVAEEAGEDTAPEVAASDETAEETTEETADTDDSGDGEEANKAE